MEINDSLGICLQKSVPINLNIRQKTVPAYFSLGGYSALGSGRQRKICRQTRNLSSPCSNIPLQKGIPINLNIRQKTLPPFFFFINLAVLAWLQKRKMAETEKTRQACSLGIDLQKSVPINLNIRQKSVPNCLYALFMNFNRGE